ncbi:hypothetical protein EYC84_011928 [Monilinia fructicola]|uniref:Uncharacterized protein n=1 Tax=Monilinia fructicola TaxID=38448 RepID=A0A5M9J4S8_MONFR|nr:hypothetical protein EYC84_011928 [Monilinia fructicola]
MPKRRLIPKDLLRSPFTEKREILKPHLDISVSRFLHPFNYNRLRWRATQIYLLDFRIRQYTDRPFFEL